jgi:hypothetical protein
MINVSLQSTDLQFPLDIAGLLAFPPNNQVRDNTHISPGANKPQSLWLRPGSSWYSPGGAFRLTLQASDGNLILESVDASSIGLAQVTGGPAPALDPNNQMRWVPVWSAKSNGKGVTEVDFQEDGNLVAYAGSNPVFNTGTFGIQRPILYLQDDGNLVVYADGPTAKWASNTSVLSTPGKNT